jgi:HD-GYP domain-containing protein (c-di-GMP phosphodiesterase class II)
MGASVERLRLLDLLASLSVAGDLGMGLPPGESMRSCVIGTGLARRLGLGEEETGHALYTTLLFHLGCSAYAHERAAAFGDEIALNEASARTNFLDPRDMLKTMLPAATSGRGLGGRMRITAYLLVRGNEFGRRATTATCEVARRMAGRLGLPAQVQQALYEVFEYWNGKGTPRGLEGEESLLPARLAQVGAAASRFSEIGGAELAVAALRDRAGGMLDPHLCDLFASHAPDLIADSDAGDPRALLLEREPEPHAYRDREQLADLATVFADFADLKTPFTHGHSREVARLAAATGKRMALDAEAVSQLRLGGLLHDLGRVSVSTSIWERPGALSTTDWEQVRLHPYHSERILASSAALEPLARIVGMHHERLDGSGYHRGSKARELPAAARILAAADAYQAMTQTRPHRDALAPEQAAKELGGESRAGRLDPDVVAALLEVAGGRRRSRRGDLRPAQLTEREVEVLGLLAAGCSNRDIAERLVISRRTAEHHVQHIYAKIGVSSRAAAAVFALEHDLLDGGS